MRLKAINLGLPKSGTTTLARAMKLAGWKVADHRIRARQTDNTAIHGEFVADLLYRGYFGSGDPASLMPEFDAISETSLLGSKRSVWPQTDLALVRALRTRYPELRLLATRRTAFEMSQSMLAWADLGSSRLPANAVPGLPKDFGVTSKERVQWIDGHYETLRQVFHGDPLFLEVDVAASDAKSKVAAFLNLDLPWWGQANANPIRQTSDSGLF